MNDAPRRTELDPDRVRQLLLCLDGLRYSFAICLSNHFRAMQSLRSFEAMKATGVPTSAAVQVVADLWSIIDAAHRIRLLINRMPLIPKKDPAIRTFLDATAQVEDLRHYVQHINNEIGALLPSAPPLWGSISWEGEADPGTCFTLMTGTPHLAQSLPGLVFDTHEQKFVRRCELTAGNNSIDLNSLIERIKSLKASIGVWANSIQFADGSSYDFEPNVTAILYSNFRLVVSSAGGDASVLDGARDVNT